MRGICMSMPVAAVLLLAMALPLAGCAARYDPVVMDVADPAQFAADRAECTKIADASASSHGRTILRKTINGAAGSTDLAAINPLTIAFGAGKGLISGLFVAIGLTADSRQSVFQACLTRRAGQHHYGVLGMR